MKNIVHVSDVGGEWEGIYVDGTLVDEGHSLDPRQVLEALGIEFEHRETDMTEISHLPENLEELV